jgi:hypothetical protein
MQWHKFIFSEKRQVRLLRHILFWIAWGIYFLLCDYVFGLPNHSHYVYSQSKTGFVILGPGAVFKILMLFGIYASACYIFIYALLPQLIKSQWIRATTNVLLLCLALFSAAWVMYWNIFPVIDSRYGTYKANDYFARFWPAVYLGIINTGKVVAAAAIIKYLKYWWLKNEEKQKLEREKMNTELQLLKAQIHPDFLFKTLSTINDYAKNNSPRTSPMLVKLSDLLSYMLYECDTPLVPLDKEIEMMNGYMEMARMKHPASFEMELSVRGDTSNKLIAPFLLFPFIENGFKQTNALNGNEWLNMDLEIDGALLYMKLANSIIPGTVMAEQIMSNGLSDAQKRLTLIYPSHELKIYTEQEMLITHLKIQLNDTTASVVNETEKPVMVDDY